MSFLSDDSAVRWAVALIAVVPLLIVGSGELAERLRQANSVFLSPVMILRNWVVPSATLWVLVVAVFEIDSQRLSVRVLATVGAVSSTLALLGFTKAGVGIIRQRSQRRGHSRVPELVLLLPRLAVLLVAAWILFAGIWDVDLSGFLAALGVGSLVISLALQPTLSGLASGLLLVADRPFSPGDWMRVNDLEGQVVDVKWRSSRIRDRNGDLHIITNAQLADSTIINFDEPSPLHRVVVPVQVAYSNSPTNAKEMLLAAARATPGVLEDPPPRIKVVQIDDPLMGYEAQLWIDDYSIAPRVSSDFGSLVWYHSHRMNVPLPSPAYDLFHHNPAEEAAESTLSAADLAHRLRSSPLLSDAESDDLDLLANVARSVRYARGEVILGATGGVNDLFMIWEGLARVVVGIDLGESIEVIELGSGDVFGLLDRADRLRFPPAVVAVTDCEIVIVDGETAGIVTSRNAELGDRLGKIFAARRRRIHRAQLSAAASHAGAHGEPIADGALPTDQDRATDDNEAGRAT
ncbi:MAG: mechanosensitive ion channel domain-containing protein [Acidimicrobiales bacterium]